MKIWAAALGAAILLLPCGAFAQTSSAPVRHLVYSFTWGTSNDTQMHTSGMSDSANAPGGNSMGTASGMVDYTGGTNDKGTITVDVLREQPDTGLVVDVSEQANERRSAPAATCVVFSDTTIVCDPTKRINAEELTLLRYLGVHFVDPLQLDAKQHWKVSRSGAISTTSDYTISKNADSAMTIDEVRVVTESGAKPETTNVNATIGYDFKKTVPTSVTEYAIMRSEQGEQYNTVKTQTILTLQSDSMTAAKN